MIPPVQRLRALASASCKVFNTTFNPEGLRLGNKILKQRLRGPALLNYYNLDVKIAKDMIKQMARINPQVYSAVDPKEEERLFGIEMRKRRGKGAPKKMTKEEFLAKKSTKKKR
jgi:small subunit ribosomal protein S33